MPLLSKPRASRPSAMPTAREVADEISRGSRSFRAGGRGPREERGRPCFLRQAVSARRNAWRSVNAQDVQRILRLDPGVDDPDAEGTCKALRQEIARQEATRKDPKSGSLRRNDRKAILDNLEAEARREQVGALRDRRIRGQLGRTFQRSALTP